MEPSPKEPKRSRRVSPFTRGSMLIGSVALVFLLGIGSWRNLSAPADPARLDAELRQAIGLCQPTRIAALIADGADVNRETVPGAGGSGLVDDAGVFPAVPAGSRPIDAYARCETPETLATLQAAGVDLQPHMRRLADQAMMPPRPEVFRWLLQNGLSPEARWRTLEGWETLCHRVARRGQIELLRILQEEGADLSLPDSENMTPLARVERVIEQHAARLSADPQGQEILDGGFDPRALYIDVIALLQQATGTE
ncbi:ankyrin repeat domain-containing protein [Pararhodobacter marinus]|uniref:ankyrin repeat domain-containing protein n=1 Tax=Pararhodobacter marinus TaxID=2184063 RepID=UPI0011B1D642|nr:ankyrin repeat domain-containing protein [Pararhodobacter marinus]